ncbi:MAG: hypothetical protein IH968_05230 [Gemmatimonadetes bacterium]|nr:hypothetical protein [Gemmatimonadota bacterium]
MTEPTQEFRAPDNITPEELADDLARLVWESFSDFVAAGETEPALADLGLMDENGNPDQRAVEEALIFLMWAHTRGAQMAFVGRAPDELLKRALDGLHAAVFEDMVENGTPETQLPVFEQRVGARYQEYHTASAQSDGRLGKVAVQHLTGGEAVSDELTWAVTERALAVARPLKDYLDDIQLIP